MKLQGLYFFRIFDNPNNERAKEECEWLKKQKPYATFETYEAFNKHIDRLIRVGKDAGFEEGVAVGVSFIYQILDEFDHDVLVNAQYLYSERKRAKWDKERESEKLTRQKVAEEAIEDYIKSIRI